MSDYQMNINGKLTESDMKSIDQYLGMINYDDSLSITLQNFEQKDPDIINELCRNNRILIGKEETSMEGKYSIKGIKEKHL